MSIWDRDKLLGGKRMDQEIPEKSPFFLYGMKTAGELPDDIGDPSFGRATKTLLLIEEAAEDGEGGYVTLAEREAMVVGTLSGPIAEMQSTATEEDFPVVVCWEVVPTKSATKATVLNFLAEAPGVKPAGIPGEWGSA